jgi:hypothetical protein
MFDISDALFPHPVVFEALATPSGRQFSALKRIFSLVLLEFAAFGRRRDG